VSGSAEGRSPFARRPQTAELSAPQGSGAQPAPTKGQARERGAPELETKKNTVTQKGLLQNSNFTQNSGFA